MTRYRFLRTKRYPHPDGPKRAAGTVYPIDAGTAEAWLRSGIIEAAEPEPEPKAAVAPEPEPEAAPAPKRSAKPRKRTR